MVAASRLGALARDRGARWVMAGWTVFTVENLVMSEYKADIKKLWGGASGPTAYMTTYATLSTLASFSIFAAYWRFAQFGVMWTPATLQMRTVAFTLRAAGIVTLSQLCPPINLGALQIALGLYEPPKDVSPQVRGQMACPFDFNAYAGRGEVYGITRVSRRPELAGVGAFGIGSALLATNATQAAFWGLGPVTAFTMLALHSDRVQRRGGELSSSKEAQTSLMPFWAFLDGRQKWTDFQSELVLVNALAGVGLAFFFTVGGAIRPAWMAFGKRQKLVP